MCLSTGTVVRSEVLIAKRQLASKVDNWFIQWKEIAIFGRGKGFIQKVRAIFRLKRGNPWLFNKNRRYREASIKIKDLKWLDRDFD